MMSKSLIETIDRIVPTCGDWCSLEKAHTLAAMVIAVHPRRIVEIGVWMGGSFIPMALALKQIGGGRILGIDPWRAGASVMGQEGPNAEWWSRAPHDDAYHYFIAKLNELDLVPISDVERITSDDYTGEIRKGPIDILHIDGNHSDQAMRDVARFGSGVRCGGFVIADDIGWGGGGVGRAVEMLGHMGFVELYKLGSGAVFQKVA